MSIVCHADVSKATDFQLNHNFTIFKNGKLVFMTVTDREDARYDIPAARSSHTGDYKCAVKAGSKAEDSKSLHVQVTGECAFRQHSSKTQKENSFPGTVIQSLPNRRYCQVFFPHIHHSILCEFSIKHSSQGTEMADR